MRVTIVEDNAQLRAAFGQMVGDSEGMHLVSAYPSGEAALEELAVEVGARPHVVLMDIQLPGMTGVECVRRLRVAAPEILVVMLTVFEHTDWIFDPLKAGAMGYVLKRAPREEIVDAVRQVYEGGAPMSCSVARKVVQFFGSRPVRARS